MEVHQKQRSTSDWSRHDLISNEELVQFLLSSDNDDDGDELLVDDDIL